MADVTLPSLGESVTEGIITRWFKAVGDRVERDEPLFEVSTDKVDSEMPSPASGVLREILAGEGDTVATGARVAVIDESAAASPPPAPPAPEAPAATAPAPETRPPFPEPTEVSGVVVSPVVRRILADAGVDPAGLRGSGPGGSITRRDAERAAGAGPADEVTVALSPGRRRMGEHLAAAARVVPHGFVARRSRRVGARRPRRRRRGSPATAWACRARSWSRSAPSAPSASSRRSTRPSRTTRSSCTAASTWDSCARPGTRCSSRSSTPPAGLTLRSLARRVSELDERLATRRLTADDLMGGTFTVAGPPGASTLWAQPIVVAPQVAVLSVGAARRVPVVDASGALAVGRRVVLGLSFDHRVCAPSTAAAYLERVAQLLAGLDVGSER